jgi:hypothetical protein
MRPYIKHRNKAVGGSTDVLKYAWSFQRKVISTLKKKLRRNFRRSNKLDIESYRG